MAQRDGERFVLVVDWDCECLGRISPCIQGLKGAVGDSPCACLPLQRRFHRPGKITLTTLSHRSGAIPRTLIGSDAPMGKRWAS